MTYHGNITLGDYINRYPFAKTKIHTVNVFMGKSIICNVTVPRYIFHMNIVDAINDYDGKYFRFKVNTFDQIVEKVCIENQENEDFKTLNIWIREYRNFPIEYLD